MDPNHPAYSVLLFGAPSSSASSSNITPSTSYSNADGASPYPMPYAGMNADQRQYITSNTPYPHLSPGTNHGVALPVASGTAGTLIPSYHPGTRDHNNNNSNNNDMLSAYSRNLSRGIGQDDGSVNYLFGGAVNGNGLGGMHGHIPCFEPTLVADGAFDRSHALSAGAGVSVATVGALSRQLPDDIPLGPPPPSHRPTPPLFSASSSPAGAGVAPGSATGSMSGPSPSARPWVPQERGPWREPSTPVPMNFLSLVRGGSEGMSGGLGGTPTGFSPDVGGASNGGMVGTGNEIGSGYGANRRQMVTDLPTSSTASSSPYSQQPQQPHHPHHSHQHHLQQQQPRSQSLSAGMGMSTSTDYDYPKSSVYPENLYKEVLPEGTSWAGGRQVSAGDCGQALSIYEHLLDSVPHIRPLRQTDDDNPDLSPEGAGGSGSTSLQPLLDLAAEGVSLLRPEQDGGRGGMDGSYIVDGYDQGGYGHAQADYHSCPPPDHVTGAGPSHDRNPGPRSHSHLSSNGIGNGNVARAGAKRGGKDKAQTQCLGCGATETPEWRRGPMGPRTLCNACGLVHMKLQRKRKKQEEKAAAAAATAAGGEGVMDGYGPPTKIKKVKNDEGG